MIGQREVSSTREPEIDGMLNLMTRCFQLSLYGAFRHIELREKLLDMNYTTQLPQQARPLYNATLADQFGARGSRFLDTRSASRRNGPSTLSTSASWASWPRAWITTKRSTSTASSATPTAASSRLAPGRADCWPSGPTSAATPATRWP